MTEQVQKFPTGLPVKVHTENEADARFLKVNQSQPQTVANGAPTFASGIIIKAGQRFILDG